MEKPIKLSWDQKRTLESMNEYWEEISKRETVDRIAHSELTQLFSVLAPIDVLLIVGDYAKTYSDG